MASVKCKKTCQTKDLSCLLEENGNCPCENEHIFDLEMRKLF